MKKLALLLAILSLGCSKDNPLVLEELGKVVTTIQLGSLASTTSKVPPCYAYEFGLETLTYELVDAQGVRRIETTKVEGGSGDLASTAAIRLPLGTYTVEELYISNANGDKIFSIPNVDETALVKFSNLATPFQLEVSSETYVRASMLCFTSTEIPDATLTQDFTIFWLKSVWLEIANDCVALVRLNFDGFITELISPEKSLIEVVIQDFYEVGTVEYFDLEGNRYFEVIGNIQADPEIYQKSLVSINPVCN